jgi:hypothetical protein
MPGDQAKSTQLLRGIAFLGSRVLACFAARGAGSAKAGESRRQREMCPRAGGRSFVEAGKAGGLLTASPKLVEFLHASPSL